MKKLISLIPPIIACFILTMPLSAQRPLSEILGLLEVYDNIDTSSLYIGKNAGRNIDHQILMGMGSTSVNPFQNTFVGKNAGVANDRGKSNSFFGFYAGAKNIEYGNNNSFFGSESGRYNIEGERNSFFGANAGRDNNYGHNNSFYGAYSGLSNLEGSSNSFFGSGSGRFHSNGNDNSFFGKNAGYNNIDGDDNSFFGVRSGEDNQGSSNSFFGSLSGLNNTSGDQNTFIGRRSGENNISGSNNTYLGYSAAMLIESGSSNTILGRGAGNNFYNGSQNIIIGDGAGPIDNISNTISKKLYIDIKATNIPLLYGDFDTDLIRINGDLDVTGAITGQVEFDGSSIQLKNLGTTDDKGIIWSETINKGFGMIYDGEGSDNRLHLREYFGTKENLMTFKANGHVGIDNEDPQAKLHILGGGDATLTTGGYAIHGDKTGTNLVIDDNEIMARNNGTSSDLYLNRDGGDVNIGGKIIINDGTDVTLTEGGYAIFGDQADLNLVIDDNEIMARKNNSSSPLNLNVNGGDVRLGGKIRIKDDVTAAETGQIRFNTSTSDFEGYNGSKWCSLTGKKEYSVFIGPGSFYTNDEAVFNQDIAFAYESGESGNTIFTAGNSKTRIIPLNLPVGSTISQVKYYYREDALDTSLEMKLIKYGLGNSDFDVAGFEYNTLVAGAALGWTNTTVTDNVTIENNRFYAFQLYHAGSALTTAQNIQYKGVKVTYTLP